MGRLTGQAMYFNQLEQTLYNGFVFARQTVWSVLVHTLAKLA